jgi:hypothetical protein
MGIRHLGRLVCTLKHRTVTHVYGSFEPGRYRSLSSLRYCSVTTYVQVQY